MASSRHNNVKALFYIENGLAYTSDDDVLITNILVKGIGEKDTESDLKKMFEFFGQISAITWNGANYDNCRSANVLFTSPLAVPKALLHDEYDNWTVSPNDSWLQPLVNDSGQEAPLAQQSTFLTDLNDDILIEIISYLAIKDQVALVSTSDRFLAAFETFAQIKFKAVSDHDLKRLSIWQIHQFFTFAGEHIENFELTHCHEKFAYLCDQLMKNCQNLKMLMVSRLKRTEVDDFNKLLETAENLKDLHLHDCPIGDECLSAISNLSHLEELTLTSCDHIKGYGLMLPNLKALHINNCEGLNARQLKKAISQMTQLKELSLVDWLGNLNSIIISLPEICKNLEALYLDCDRASYESVLKMNKLRTLIFLGRFRVENLIFEQEKANQIEELGIDCRYLGTTQKQLMLNFKNLKSLRYSEANDDYLTPLHALQNLESINLDSCDKISNAGLLELVKSCKNLKFVNIINTNINSDFADDLLPWIKEHKRSNGQLQFFVAGSRIQKWRLSKEYFSPEISSMVKFIYKRLKPNFSNKYARVIKG